MFLSIEQDEIERRYIADIENDLNNLNKDTGLRFKYKRMGWINSQFVSKRVTLEIEYSDD